MTFVFWCEKCAKEYDFECQECPPGELMELKIKWLNVNIVEDN